MSTHVIPVHAEQSIIYQVQSFKDSIVTVTASVPTGYSQAAGVIVSPLGHVVCNLHTIQGAKAISITTDRFRKLPAKIIRVYPKSDLALLKFPPPLPVKPVPLVSQTRTKLRDTVFHFGSSYLLDNTISEGKVTGLGTSKSQKKRGNNDIDIIRLNIRLFKGDSGGPIFNRQGELVGMIVAKNKRKDRVSFAIPANKIKKILSDI